MKYSSIESFEITNGTGIGVSIFTQGCNRHCSGCFNQEIWGLDGGRVWTSLVEDHVIGYLNREGITRLSILGGEPLLDRNIDDLTRLLRRVRDVYGDSKKIWLYTGETFEDVVDKYPELFSYVDVVVDGPFEIDKRDLTIPFRGSRNQRVINVKTKEVIY